MSTNWTALVTVIEFCKRRGLPPPTSLTTTQDDLTVQLLGSLNEALSYVAQDVTWPQTKKRINFTHAGDTAEYLALNYAVPATVVPTVNWTVKNHIQNTVWNKDTRIQVYGPVPEEQWQAMIRMSVVPVQYSFSIRAAGMCIYPIPSSPATQFSMEVKINEIVTNTSTFKELVTADNDTFLVPGRIVLAALTWTYLKTKGLPFGAEFDNYNKMTQDYLGETGNAGDVTLDSGSCYPVVPGILIPSMNWNV